LTRSVPAKLPLKRSDASIAGDGSEYDSSDTRRTSGASQPLRLLSADGVPLSSRRASSDTGSDVERIESIEMLDEPRVDCMRDMYGNPVPTHLEDKFCEWHENYVLRAPERNQAVNALLGDATGDADLSRINALLLDGGARVVRRHAERGVSPNWRGRVWSVMLDLDARAVTSNGAVYESLCKVSRCDVAPAHRYVAATVFFF
jgi:hypothetical protein